MFYLTTIFFRKMSGVFIEKELVYVMYMSNTDFKCVGPILLLPSCPFPKVFVC